MSISRIINLNFKDRCLAAKDETLKKIKNQTESDTGKNVHLQLRNI